MLKLENFKMRMIRTIQLTIAVTALMAWGTSAYGQPSSGHTLLFAQITMDVMDSLEGEEFANAIEVPDADERTGGKPLRSDQKSDSSAAKNKNSQLREAQVYSEQRYQRERKKALDALDKAMREEGRSRDQKRGFKKEREGRGFEHDRTDGDRRDRNDRGEGMEDRFDREDDRDRRQDDDDRRQWRDRDSDEDRNRRDEGISRDEG